ncbi:rod shape-determining protein MreD [Fructilactobacillus fructivorans]|nr:rod shape-determining protein MreD [Fructilactobacillus fructivorans]
MARRIRRGRTMRRPSRLKFLFPIGLVIAFLLEGSISKLFSPVLFEKFSMVPYLTLMWLVMATLFARHEKLHIGWWALGIGIVYDVYYVGIVGIFMFAFPLVVYINRIVFKFVRENLVTSSLIYMGDVLVVFILSYLGDRIAHIASLSGTQLLIYTLGPTLVLNLILFVILYFPIRALFNYFS